MAVAGKTLGINALKFMQSGNVSNDTDNVAMAARTWTNKPGDRSHISLIKKRARCEHCCSLRIEIRCFIPIVRQILVTQRAKVDITIFVEQLAKLCCCQ